MYAHLNHPVFGDIARQIAETSGVNISNPQRAWGRSDLVSGAAAQILARDGVIALDVIEATLPDAARAIADNLSQSKVNSLSAVGEHGWVVGISDGLAASVRLSRLTGNLTLATPAAYVIRNIDSLPLRITTYVVGRSGVYFDEIDHGSRVKHVVWPGEHIVIDGSSELCLFEDEGILTLNISTIPLGPYDMFYNVAEGRKLAKFSNDANISMVCTALRVFGLGRFSEANALCDRFTDSPIRELRWAVMNFHWRVRDEGSAAVFEHFAGDEDPEIADMAQKILESC